MNNVTLMGNITKSIETRFTSTSNKPVCSFTVAVKRRFSEETDFINCVAWNKTAEFIAKHFDKGRRIALVGSIQVRSWDDNEGKKHYATEVVVEQAHFADSKKAEQQNNDGGQPGDDELPF